MRFRFLFLIAATLVFSEGFAQDSFTLKGLVKDAKTGEAMPFATVFFAGTTFGTTTDEKGEYLLRVDRSGTYDLIVKFVGYELYATQVKLGEAEVSRLDISIIPGARDLGSVVVVAKQNVQWKRYLEDFEAVFLGQSINGTNSKILNKEVLDFVYDEETSQLNAYSAEPIIIENKELGYNVKYYLEQFVLDYPSDISGFYGYTIFEEIKPKNDRKAKVQEKNRTKAYNGSPPHFFKALFSNQLKEEGFIVELSIEETADGLVNSKDVNLYEMLENGQTGDYKQLSFESYLTISYMKEKESQRYAFATAQEAALGVNISNPEEKNYQASQILLLDGYPSIDFEANGFIRNPTSFYSLGYWGFEKAGDLVPLDYTPIVKK